MIHIFFHVATINDYQSIIDEIMESLYNSKLNKHIQELHVNVAGDGIVYIDNNCGYNFTTSKLKEYEFPTLKMIQNHCIENPDDKILYIHTKGVSTCNNEAIDDWRKYMTYFVIEKGLDCIHELDTYDVCGVDWMEEPARHFSGNFWWANAKYIKTLPNIKNISNENSKYVLSLRHNCEFWIGMNKDVKYKSLHNSNIDVYKRHLVTYKMNQYES